MSEKLLSMRIVKQKMDQQVVSGNKNYKSFQQQYLHDFRFEEMDEDYLKRPNEKNKYFRLDRDLENLTNEKNIEKNFNIVNSKWEEIQELSKVFHKKKLHKDTKPTINFLLSFSTDFDLDEEHRKQQANCVEKFIKSKYDFPLYLVQHNDEKALHYSFTILNFDKNTMRPISKQIDTSKLQDDISEWLIQNNQDYGHTRGVKKTISNAEHRTIMEGKVQELENKIHSKEVELKELENKNKTLTSENLNLEARNQSLETKNNELEKSLNDLETKFRESKNNYEHSIEIIKQTIQDFNELSLSFKGKNGSKVLGMLDRYMKSTNTSKFDGMMNKLIKLVNEDEQSKQRKQSTRAQSNN